MRTVRVNKGELVNSLTENRKKHKSDFEAASKGYREYMIAELSKVEERLKAGETVELRFDFDKPPQDHTKEYDVALKMMEMSTDSIIELGEGEFRQLVLDDWDWKRGWEACNLKYLSK